ncbi:MAG: M48 family metalloprotease [Alphaproteobacteria bacterium]|nr:M48 family metalloprotease [Alphaproteobacteria bacterium]
MALAAALILPLSAQAGLIRDAEIETTLQTYARPIFRAADIDPESVRIFIVSNPEVNAYVAGGLNIFIHTGLIREAKTPGMLIGVIAHETGHIAGAHLSQFREKANRASIGNVIGLILGAAAAVGGSSQAGAGIIAGSQNMAGRSFLSDIRRNEQSADQAALTFLDANAISSSGMLSMFETLRRRDSGLAIRDKYLLSHPLNSERIAAMRNHIAESSIPTDQVPSGFAALHARMLAKLVAFIEPYDVTLTLYPPGDGSVAGRYARAIAEFRRSRFPAALAGINGLIRDYPADAFFYDTKGQILFENGKLDAAAAAYAKANSLAPGSALIATEYAKTLIAQQKPEQLSHAIALLERSREIDDSYDVTWRQFALAYGRQGRLGLSYAALAEEAALAGDYETVLQHVARARRDAGNDTALILQLDDLTREAKAQLEKKKDAESTF